MADASPPFVGLQPFLVEQSEFFFGRDSERDLIIANLRTHRLTLLYGPSGVGKTSLLNAGVLSRLRAAAVSNLQRRGRPGGIAVTFSTWQQRPGDALAEEIRASVASIDATVSIPKAADLNEALRLWTTANRGDLLLILDQFEQFFVHHRGEARERFVAEFAACVNNPDSATHFLIAVREDWLSALDIFKGHIPGLFENYLRLMPLQYEGAKAAIEGPIASFNHAQGTKIAIEDLLVRAVLARSRRLSVRRHEDFGPVGANRSLGRLLARVRAVFGVPADVGAQHSDEELRQHSFDAPAIQLIMARLWSEDVGRGVSQLRLSTFARLTQASDIVDDHVARIMKSFGPRDQLRAAKVLDRLVTPAGTKIAQTQGNLASFTGLPPKVLDALLKKLTDPELRLLNPVAPPRDVDDSAYEIAHDVLAAALARWRLQYLQWRRLTVSIAVLAVVIGGAVSGIGYFREQSRQLEVVNVRLNQEIAKREAAERLAASLRDYKTPLDDDSKPTPPAQSSGGSTPPLNPRPLPGSGTELLTGFKLWGAGRTLRVDFLDGDPALQDRVRRTLSDWTRYANVTLQYVDNPDAEVRVTFKDGEGSWAYIGTDALAQGAGEPTVSFGLVTTTTPDESFRQTVLHEFGHVLGLIHEIQNPNANINWNKDRVARDLKLPLAELDATLFSKQSAEWLPPKPFDPQSIMMYDIPAEWTGGTAFRQSSRLSEQDKVYIATLYPGRVER